ncbi:MAG: ATP-binding protein [Bacteroidia bacterium]|nr:ATP-binding protein [Bacteroidia bacterium]
MIRRIVITGAESTGKTTLARQLAEHFHTVWIPEYAREYVENLHRPYQYGDVEIIMHKQIEQTAVFEAGANHLLFLDTWLIITKIWFLEVYGHYPELIDEVLRNYPIDLYLLCDTDLPWIPDPVRENKDKRNYLSERYRQELISYGFNFQVIDGTEEKRLGNAIAAVKKNVTM